MATIWRKLDKVLRISLEVLAPSFINVLFTVLGCTHVSLDRSSTLEEGPRVTISLPLETLELLLWTATPKPDVQMARSLKTVIQDIPSCAIDGRIFKVVAVVTDGVSCQSFFYRGQIMSTDLQRKTKQDLYNSVQ